MMAGLSGTFFPLETLQSFNIPAVREVMALRGVAADVEADVGAGVALGAKEAFFLVC